MIEGLTKSQIENLIEFIELRFIDTVRNDPDIDNIDYVIDMVDTLKNSVRRIRQCKKNAIGQ